MGLIIDCYTKKYAVFSGRARRKEFWLFMLFLTLALYIPQVILTEYMLLQMADTSTSSDSFSDETGFVMFVGYGIWFLFIIFSLAPAISVSVRRLHDVNKSGWWYWISLVPLINLIMIFFYAQKGTAGVNRFGPDPLGES
ncbi:MAG: hypothetical protein CMF53_02460 [Legionellales bacterium]|nr:hypothetical protein [Legionellales bacterium]